METLDRRVELVDERLSTLVESVEPPALAERLSHVTLSGGKRVRPAVTLLACEAAGGDPEDAVDFAVGIELVHNASLVVDDIIDRSELRRGNPSAWAEYGYGPAIVASDGLLGEAFALFSANEHAMTVVAEAMVELGEGEATELVAEPENEAEYMELARRKTGALFRAAAEVGAIAAGADGFTVESMGEYAERVGVAFQMRDDVLDATADAADLGKPAGQDEEMDRPSLIQVTDLTAEEADRRATAESDRALDALATATVENGEAREYLEQLAEYVVSRER
ncbi:MULTISPECIES: polyprenyl synthetase family protein [Halolamina]|uniref:Geranylgeranyl diphosphate synthase, type I n=1 Tax=Halolamina pelagica TaxID=699431 RepID=A0A1I5PQ55_9EURY|nr:MULTISPECIES: polyprenyl synthetase family protein [Halolamina]NHX34913.1 polyprenyl synthetase family protein [Halolamina sp. R1-12]SFP36248.1 geranylgeranyl diphosphate synthase, type I [Halolamina pelagica]